MAKNEFLPFGTAANANVLTNTDYEALPARSGGFSSGVAKSEELNKAWRQGTVMAAAIGQFIADKTGQDVLDDGNVPALQAGLQSALNVQATGRLIGPPQVFKSSGTYTPSAGTNYVIVEAVGGGGAGGGAPATGASAVSVGTGGTSGSYGKGIYTTGFSGVAVTVGAKGAAIAGETGGVGGSSLFGSLLIAPGGAGGIRKGPSEPILGITGSSSGATVTGGNIISAPGTPGGYSMAISQLGTVGGPGAPSVFGGGGTLNIAGMNGVDGTAPGSGGGGAFQGENKATALSGGAGAPGIVIVWEYA